MCRFLRLSRRTGGPVLARGGEAARDGGRAAAGGEGRAVAAEVGDAGRRGFQGRPQPAGPDFAPRLELRLGPWPAGARRTAARLARQCLSAII